MNKINFSKVISIVLGATMLSAMLFGLVGCGTTQDSNDGKDEPVEDNTPAYEFTYTLKSDDTYDISGMTTNKGKGSTDDLVIPSQYEGKDVTSISYLGGYSISVCKLTLPKTITSIEKDVFKNLYYNTSSEMSVASTEGNSYVFSVYYQGTVADWLNITFTNYKSNPLQNIVLKSGNLNLSPINEFYCLDENGQSAKLTSLYLTNGETIGNYQFAGFNTLESVTVSGDIGNSAFESCYDLALVACSGSTKIGGYAFCYDYDIQTINLGESMVDIGSYAFYGVKTATINFPASLKFIGMECFTSKNMTMTFDSPCYWRQTTSKTYQTEDYSYWDTYTASNLKALAIDFSDMENDWYSSIADKVVEKNSNSYLVKVR
jgi:hypothetical protein